MYEKTTSARGKNASNLIAHLKVHHLLKHKEFYKTISELQQSMSSKTNNHQIFDKIIKCGILKEQKVAEVD